MTEAERKLAALWNADAPPARDAAFRLAVHERLVKRRLRVRAALLGLIGVAAMLTVLVAAPGWTAFVNAQNDALMVTAGAALLMLSAFFVRARWRRR